jgi:hypothetical protein
MASLSDTLTVGLVLVLLFGSIALYLYTRIQQAEQKISLLESILLDLKMSTEVKSYSELPAHHGANLAEAYVQYEADNCNREQIVHCFDKKLASTPEEDTDVEQYKSVIENAINDDIVNSDIVNSDTVNSNDLKNDVQNVNYESMTLKELQSIAKTRGITGSMKKGQLIEALKALDRPEPGSFSSNFLETSSILEE